MTALRHTRILVAIAAAALLAAFAVADRPLIAHDDDSNPIEGSWAITIDNSPFRILRTMIHAGNGVVDSYAFPPITPTPGALINSGGHGSWKRLGPRKYSVTVKYFQLNPSLNASFNVLDSVGTVRETVRVSKDGKSYTSEFATEIALPNGTPIIQNGGTTSATRIEVDPLP